jgi:hypothetical protein
MNELSTRQTPGIIPTPHNHSVFLDPLPALPLPLPIKFFKPLTLPPHINPCPACPGRPIGAGNVPQSDGAGNGESGNSRLCRCL